jgi:hypothetical protein
MLRRLGEGIRVMEAPQRFLGLEVGARMTVLETDRGTVVHSPIAVEPAIRASLGPPGRVVGPNKLHHLYLAEWLAAGWEGWGPQGLVDKRPDLAFAGVLTADHPFGDDLVVVPLRCFPFTEEVVLLHRPSRTLVVTDLLFHITPDFPWTTRVGMALAGGYPGCCTTLLERWGFDRPTARREMAMLATLDFDRLVMAHGEVIETGGNAAFREAMAWLGFA